MDDLKIIELFLSRSEEAIAETELKYGKLCRYIAMNILRNIEDSEECVNDTYFGAWNAIPPQKPNRFSVFISRITRNLALKKYEYISADKRNPEVLVSLTEIEECVSGQDCVEAELENKCIEKGNQRFSMATGYNCNYNIVAIVMTVVYTEIVRWCNMSRKEKLILKLKSKPKDFEFREVEL